MVRFPDSVISGEILAHCVTDAAYTGVTAYVVGPQRHEVPFTQTGTEWNCSADTAAWSAGLYAFELWAVESPTKRHLLERGQITVTASLISSGVETIDPRSEAQKMVEMIEAMMKGNASAGVRRYRINNRELERYSLAELLQLLTYWRNRLSIERRREAGLPLLGAPIRFYI